MVPDTDSLDSVGRSSSRARWVAAIALAVVLFAGLGLGIRALGDGSELLPVVAVAAIVLGALGLSVWLIDTE